VADIVAIGKAFGGGFPLSGLMTRDDIASAKPWSVASGSSSSYGGNPLAAAAGSAAIRAIEEEGLVDNARTVGDAMLRALSPFVDDYPFVGHVRGRGLLLGLELVRDKKTREPLARTVTRRIFDECVRHGLLTMSYSPSFRLQPALTIDRSTAMNGIAVLREVFDLVKREGAWAA
jgi:4-aminobutyrate aminotransferase-like enzyme